MKLHAVLPNDIDDPANPSGGNVYDRRVIAGLRARGWSVREHAVPGHWPDPTGAERAGLARRLAALPDGAAVLLDGLIAVAVPELIVAAAARLRLAVLAHMAFGERDPQRRARECEALSAADAIVTTSQWSRRRLIELYGLAEQHIHVAPPGVDTAPLAPGSGQGSALVCVAAVTPGKGHDLLVTALAALGDAPWTCVCAGPTDRDPGFADAVRRQADAAGIGDRLSFVGPRTGAALAAVYAGADLLVLPSRGESYGMVVTEALARGIPVLATAVAGLPDTLGRAADGTRPGLLVPPDDPAALAAALRRWLTEADLRRRLRTSARVRRLTLTGWSQTARLVSSALSATVTKVSADR